MKNFNLLKPETIQELTTTFKEVEIIGLSKIRIHINDRGNKIYLKTIIKILKTNNESGPLKIHEEAAKSFNCLYYIDIDTI